MEPAFVITFFESSDNFSVKRFKDKKAADKFLEEPGEPDQICYLVLSKKDLKNVPERVLLLMYNWAKGGYPVKRFENRPDGEERGYRAMLQAAETAEGETIESTVPEEAPKKTRRKLTEEEKAAKAAEKAAEKEAAKAAKAAEKAAEKEAAKAAKAAEKEAEKAAKAAEKEAEKAAKAAEREAAKAAKAAEREARRAAKEEAAKAAQVVYSEEEKEAARQEIQAAEARYHELREVARQQYEQAKREALAEVAAVKEKYREVLGRRVNGPMGPRRTFKDYGFGRPPFADQIRQARAGTKVALMIDLLAKPEGVLLSELQAAMSATGKPVNARAWLGYDLNDKHGYGFRSEPEGEDHRLFLVLPEGMDAPLPHRG